MKKLKSKWSDAPEWAQYLARDESGEEFWFSTEPDAEQESCMWVCGFDGHPQEPVKAFDGDGKDIDWAYTLQERPHGS